MAVVKKLVKKTVAKKTVIKKKAFTRLELTLPTKRSVPSTNLRDYTNLIFGAKKIGKTTLSSHFPGTLHFMFEAGSKALAIFDRLVPTWEHFLGYIKLLEEGKHEFLNVTIDTGAIAYNRCLKYICSKEGLNHPSDRKDYGATWSMVSTEFETAHARLASCGLGILVIAHQKIIEVEKMDGTKIEKIMPLLSGQANEYYAGSTDNIFYYEYENNQRFLTIRGSEFVDAGTRCEKNFITTSGESIYRIPMGNNSEEAYNNLVSAFNNEQIETFKPLVKRKVRKVVAKLKKIR